MSGPSIGRRAVIVDDHAGFRATLRRLLEADGWRVVGEAADGLAAIDLTTRLQPDLVLIDVGLPGMDGFAVADRLLHARATPSPAVVLISSRDATAYRERLAKSPAHGFLTKGELAGGALRSIVAGAPR